MGEKPVRFFATASPEVSPHRAGIVQSHNDVRLRPRTVACLGDKPHAKSGIRNKSKLEIRIIGYRPKNFTTASVRECTWSFRRSSAARAHRPLPRRASWERSTSAVPRRETTNNLARSTRIRHIICAATPRMRDSDRRHGPVRPAEVDLVEKRSRLQVSPGRI